MAFGYLNESLIANGANAETWNNLANALKEEGKWAEATAAYEQALRLKPDHPQIAFNLGIALHQQGNLDQAVDYYRQALRLDPECVEVSNNLATALKELGLFDEAIVQFRETLRLQPDHALATYNLSELAAAGRFRFSPAELDRLKACMVSEHISPLDKSFFGFALATVLDKQGSYEEAFTYCLQANDLRKGFLKERNISFDGQKHDAFIQGVMDTFDQAYFERVKGWGLDAELPVFIIGMPRSGSTLVEQILASHPDVFGAGELEVMPRMTKRLAPEAHAQFYANPGKPNQGALQEMANRFLGHLNQLGHGAARVTVKALENYLHLGLLAALFPRARIIHCRRDPLDVCLSCYFQNFREVVFAWSLDDIGACYRSYDNLMAHWARVLPMPIHEVCYEELVQDQETVTRNLLAFCGLEWNEGCLTFYKTRRAVSSASAVQVRQPVSNQAIGRWKHYRSHLESLFKILGRPEM